MSSPQDAQENDDNLSDFLHSHDHEMTNLDLQALAEIGESNNGMSAEESKRLLDRLASGSRYWG
jgi:hypothetical protein